MSCSSSCATQDHNTWGECVRAKNVHLGDLMGTTIQKRADKNLDAYAKARKHGIQPASTNPADVQRAVQISEKTGRAYQA